MPKYPGPTVPGPYPGYGPGGPEWLRHYRGKYSQRWVSRLGMIPNLATTTDNSFSIYQLLAWLQRAIKMLFDDFANLELEWEQFKNAMIELLKVLIPQLIREFIHSDEFHDFIFDLIWEWWYLYQEDRILEIERQIRLIWQEINLIWQHIEQLENVVFEANWIVLVEGVDYDIKWYNDYHVTTEPLVVSVIDGVDRWILQIACDRLRNETPKTSMVQGHNNPLDTVPEQAIFGITFKGDWVALNGAGSVREPFADSNAIFNIYPKDGIRASWQPFFQVQRDWDGNTFVCCWRSYNDGYNTQFSESYPEMIPGTHYMDWGTFTYKITALKP